MYKKIISNTLSQISSKIATALISIVLLSILTNYLSLELFGLYNKIYNYLGIFAFLADLGLYTIAIREISHNAKEELKIIGNVMTLRAILWVSIIGLSLLIATFLPGYNSLLSLQSIAIIGVFTLFSLMNSSILALMQAKMKIEFNLISTIVWKLLNIAMIAIVVFFLYPKQGGIIEDRAFLLIMCAGLLWISVQTILNFLYASKMSQLKFLFDWEYIRHIIKITLPYGIALFLSVVYFKVDIILLSLIEPLSTSNISVALYSLPMKIVEVIMIVWGYYLSSILPALSTYFANKDTFQVQKLIYFSFRVLYSLWVLVLLLWMLFKERIIELIANKEYIHAPHIYSSSDVFFIVLLVAFFFFLSSIFNYVLIATKNESRILKINIFVTLINILGNILLIPKFSFMWSAIVTVISQITLLILWFFATKDILHLKWNPEYTFSVGGFAICLYFFGRYILEIVHLWKFLEIFIFGSLFALIYAWCIAFLSRREITAHFLWSRSSH